MKKLLFIPYRQFSFKNPASIISERKRLRDFYHLYLEDFNDAEVFFYTMYYDWISFYFLKRLATNNKVYYVECGKHKIKKI